MAGGRAEQRSVNRGGQISSGLEVEGRMTLLLLPGVGWGLIGRGTRGVHGGAPGPCRAGPTGRRGGSRGGHEIFAAGHVCGMVPVVTANSFG